MGITGITAEIAGTLGFKTGEVGNLIDNEVTTPAEIHSEITGAKQAQLIAVYINGGALKPDVRTDTDVDFVVGHAFDTIRSHDETHTDIIHSSASPSGSLGWWNSKNPQHFCGS